jgi:uncharacterized protein involved in propanediol utilization
MGTTRGVWEPGCDSGAVPAGNETFALPWKAREALRLLERRTGRRLPIGMAIRLRSNIPPGKGLSSSSTDILSVLSAANACLGAGLMAEELYRIAAAIEPTDPCLSEDILVFYQHTGKSGECIGLPPVTLIYFDAAPGKEVDTLAMRRNWPAGAGLFFSWLLGRFTAAAAAGDYAGIFETLTQSAEYNQPSLPLPGFADLYRLADELRAGLVVAHSGTIAGLLTREEDAAAAMARLSALVSGEPSRPIYMEHYSSPHHRPVWPTAFPVH